MSSDSHGLTRRHLVGAAGAALGLSALPLAARAQAWQPTQPITILVGFAPGVCMALWKASCR